MAFCQNCGAKLPEGTKFCTNCGTPVAQPAVAVTPTPAPAFIPTPAEQSFTAPVEQTYSVPEAPSYAAPEQPAYSAPSYAAPEQPAYAAPGYAAPEQPAYAAPGYAAPEQPAYSAPSYAAPEQPAYAAPSYAAPEQTTYSAPQDYTAPQSYSAPAAPAPVNARKEKKAKPSKEKPQKAAKSGRKTGIIAIIAAVVVLALLVGAYFIFFRGKDAQEDPNAGVYTCASVEAAGKTFTAKDIFGDNVRLEIISADKARLYIGEDFILGDWTLKGDAFHFACDAEGKTYTLDGTLKNGVITIPDAFGIGGKMTFRTDEAKVESDAPVSGGAALPVGSGETEENTAENGEEPQTEPETEPAAEPEVAPEAEPETLPEAEPEAEPVAEPEAEPEQPAETPAAEAPALPASAAEVGKFMLESYTANDYTYGKDTLKLVGMEDNYLELRADGSGEMKLLESITAITWKDGVVYKNGVQFATYTLDGDTLTLDMQGVIYTYKR